jgi:cardiolipin synthase A/B
MLESELNALEQELREQAAQRPPAQPARAPPPEELAPVMLAHYGGPAATLGGNRLKLLRDGVEAFPEMLDAIRAARRKIRLEVYMFIGDAVGDLFARALVEAAARGVQVKVLYDWLGSIGTRRAFFRKMRQAGVDVRAFRPLSFARGVGALIRRDHRKILVVDGEVAFVGGINLGAQWAPRGRWKGQGWRDDVLRIEGPSALTLERLFCASWRVEAQKRLYRMRRRHERERRPRRGDVHALILSSRRAIHRAYLRAIDRARHSVRIANAYFVPDRRLVAALRQAAQRGVDVQLILPGKSDHAFVKWAGRAFYGRLLRHGVKIYEWTEGVLHSKTAVVDGTWGTVGSFNLERTSLRFNREVNVVFTDARWGRALERSFTEDCSRCIRIDPEAWANRPLWQKLVERFCYLFRKIL